MLALVVKGEIKCPRCKKINKIEYPAKARANSPHRCVGERDYIADER